jgi:hypothetical protein
MSDAYGKSEEPGISEPIGIWDPQHQFPSAAELSAPDCIEHRIIHPGGAPYLFLHESRLGRHGNSLFAAWDNSFVVESQWGSVIRWIRSEDGFATWSDPVVLAPALEGENITWESVHFLSAEDEFWAFVAQVRSEPRDQSNTAGDMVVFKFKPGTETWSEQSRVSGFHPQNPPQLTGDGNWCMGGHYNLSQARFAISRGRDLTDWDVVEIPCGPENYVEYAETSFIAGDKVIDAYVRNEIRTGSLLTSRSHDGGKSWPLLQPSNFLTNSNRTSAGMLSTGQRYIAFNMMSASEEMGERDVLAIAVSEPGGEFFKKIVRIRNDTPPPMQVAECPKMRQWSYPSVLEHEGKVYISYTVTKEQCCLSILPLGELRTD